MASWGEAYGRSSAPGGPRCLSCGVQIESAFAAGMFPRCERCLSADRPLDPLLRWIWQGKADRA